MGPPACAVCSNVNIIDQWKKDSAAFNIYENIYFIFQNCVIQVPEMKWMGF